MKSNLFLCLSLVSLVHRIPHAEVLHPALQTRVPGAKWLQLTLQLIRPFAEMLHLAPQSGVLWATKLHPICKNSASLPPLPADKNSIKQPCSSCPFRESMYSRVRAHTTRFFDQRMKVSFASELNLVLFYWLKWHQAEVALLGTCRRVGKKILANTKG